MVVLNLGSGLGSPFVAGRDGSQPSGPPYVFFGLIKLLIFPRPIIFLTHQTYPYKFAKI